MDEQTIYTPSEVQQEAHDFQREGVTEILYGGTAGCGKTRWLRRDPIITQLYGEHERYVAARRAGQNFESKGWSLHVRQNLKQLLQTISDCISFAKMVDPGSEYSARDNLINFTCGYKQQFGHLEHEESWRDYDTNEYTAVQMDEVVNLYESQFFGLRSRIRTADPVLKHHLRICLATNPDAPLRGRWVKERFVDPAPEGRTVLAEDFEMFDGSHERSSRIYIPAYLSDNPDKEFARQYEVNLRGLPRHIMEARLFCKWDIVENPFFQYEWVPSRHVVKPFTCKEHGLVTCEPCGFTWGIPNHWPKGRTMDWGYKSPCPIHYWACNPDGDLVIWREVNFNHKVAPGKRKDSQMVAISLRKIEQEMGLWDEKRNCSKLMGPADYQIKSQVDGIWTIEDRMAAEGVYWDPCKKDRAAGTAEVVRRLKDLPSSPDAFPGLMVFDTCKELIRTILLMPVSEKDPEVPEDGGEDHWYDNLMYTCMYRTMAASKEPKKTIDECDRNDIAAARERKRSWGYGS